MGGRVGGWLLVYNKATSWLHLASWNLPDSQLRCESKMDPSVAKVKHISAAFEILIIKSIAQFGKLRILVNTLITLS